MFYCKTTVLLLVAAAVGSAEAWRRAAERRSSPAGGGGSGLRQACARKSPIMTDDNFNQVLDYFEDCYTERFHLEPGPRRRYLRAVADRIKHTSERFIRESRLSSKELLPVYMRVKELYGRLAALGRQSLRLRRESGGSGSDPPEPLFLISPLTSAFLVGTTLLHLILLMAIAVSEFMWYRNPYPECHCDMG